MHKLVPANILMGYDGTIDGFFSLVFYAYATHSMPDAIAGEGAAQPRLGQQYVYVPTDQGHAERVRVGLAKSGGTRLMGKVKRAYLSCAEGRELALLRYIEYAMRVGYRVLSDLSNPVVSAVEDLVTSVNGECEKVKQFVRFERLENGVYFARVSPKANVVPLVMGYFAERFNTQEFAIYDDAHGIACVYDRKRCQLVEVDGIGDLARDAQEGAMGRMWKVFYDAVSNDQRYNPDLRRTHMPQRFWNNLTEMNPVLYSA